MSWLQWLVIIGGVAIVVYAAFIGWLLVAGRRQDGRALAGFIPDCLVLFRRLLADDRVPRRSNLLLGALIAYLAMPIDLVPDFIPIGGQLDDAIIVALVLRTILRADGPDLLREHCPGPSNRSPRSPASPMGATALQIRADRQRHVVDAKSQRPGVVDTRHSRQTPCTLRASAESPGACVRGAGEPLAAREATGRRGESALCRP